MVKDQYPIGSAADVAALWDRIAAAHPEARADRRDGLRLEWDDRWVHIRASNTEPIVRVIAEATGPADARELTARIGRWVSSSSETTV
jgi:phosphomannomutase